jgi:hypothetical protein
VAANTVNFDKIETPFSHFILANKTLGHAKGLRELRLSQAFAKAKGTQQFTESLVFERKSGLGHLPILQPRIEYPKMGNLMYEHGCPLQPERAAASRDVEELARRLRLSKRLLRAHRLRLPDGTVLYTPRFRWCLLVKAIIEQFCPYFVPGGVVLYLGDTEGKCVHTKPSDLADLGVSTGSETKLPDVIVYDPAKNRLLLIEAATGGSLQGGKRRRELESLFADCKADLVFVAAFETRRIMQSFVSDTAWGTEVWLADEPTHLIHFNGDRFLGPYPLK